MSQFILVVLCIFAVMLLDAYKFHHYIKTLINSFCFQVHLFGIFFFILSLSRFIWSVALINSIAKFGGFIRYNTLCFDWRVQSIYIYYDSDI